MTKTIVTGAAALDLARETGAALNVYANEVDTDGLAAVSLEKAEEIAREDVSLLWVEIDG